MKASNPWVGLAVCCILALALAAGPVLAAEVVPAGVDFWATAAGHTQTSFASNPIPAGFFCEGSKPFTGRIAFQGEPLKADPAGSLDGADTIVHRLDSPAFNAKGEAVTRIQFMALSLASTKPIDTECGQFNVHARLDGVQPTTDMKIVRLAVNGGTYVAPLALNVRLVFTPVNGDPAGRRSMSLIRNVTLGPSSSAVWTYASAPRYQGRILVDTDGDGQPDTLLPQASNFIAGVEPAASGEPVTMTSCTMGTNATSCPPGYCLHQACHCSANQSTWNPYDPGSGCTYLHCLWVCVSNTGSGAMAKGGTGKSLVATPVCAQASSF